MHKGEGHDLQSEWLGWILDFAQNHARGHLRDFVLGFNSHRRGAVHIRERFRAKIGYRKVVTFPGLNHDAVETEIHQPDAASALKVSQNYQFSLNKNTLKGT